MTHDTQSTVLIGYLIEKQLLASSEPAILKKEILAELEAQLDSTIKTLKERTQ